MRSLLALFLIAGLWPRTAAAQEGGFDQKFDAFLNAFVSNGHVDYARIKRHPEPLDVVIDSIKTIDFEKFKPIDQKAYLINAYNALVIASVVEHYPIHSPLDVTGFFRGERHVIAGKSMTLDELEKGVLLQRYPDPRLHFALVCAARGCPPLRDDPYRGQILDQELEDHMSIAMMSPGLVHVDVEDRKVYLSELFTWYESDFTAPGRTLLDFVNRYRPIPVPSDFDVAFIPYDWALNDSNPDE